MKTKTLNLLLLLLIAGSTNSCKKEKKCESEICELEGRYRIEVKVSKRLPLLPNIPEDLDTTRYVREKIFYDRNQILLDTGANVCGNVNMGGWQRQCPPLEYTLKGVEIVKENGNYYIKAGHPSTPNLPLTIKKDEVSYNVVSDGDRAFIMQKDNNYAIDATDFYTAYPYAFYVFLLNLKKKGNNKFSGIWIINEGLPCKIWFPTSNDMYEYSIVEFAEVIFVKED